MALTIRPLIASDWPQVKQIYQLGIDTGDATYETPAREVDGLKVRCNTAGTTQFGSWQ